MREIDTSKWRREEGGAPLGAAYRLAVLLMKQPEAHLDEIERLVSPTVWPQWREQITQGGLDPNLLNYLKGVDPYVRYPADGMAYVFCVLAPVAPAEDSSPGPEFVPFHPVTLVLHGDEWRVEKFGGQMIAPTQLRKQPYSW